MECRHCKRDVRRIIAKGCCYACYYDPQIHKLYPKGFRGPRTHDAIRPRPGKRWVPCELALVPGFEPPEPTDAEPGTPEKIEVMAWRVRNGFRPHHPRDRRRSMK